MNLKNVRFLIMPYEIGRAHLLRLTLIARELRDRGAEVAFTWKGQDTVLEHDAFSIISVTGQDITEFTEDIGRNIVDANTLSLVEECVKDEIRAIQAFKPDAIIGDLRATLAISSKISKIPYISVVNGYWTDYFKMVALTQKYLGENNLFKYKIDFISNKYIHDTLKVEFATNFRLVAEQYGIYNLKSIYDFLVGDLNLIADIPQYCPLENLPKNYHYIGPLIWEGLNETTPSYLELLGGLKTVIYATLGNTGNEKLIQLVIDAFKNDELYEVVLTTGAYIDSEGISQNSNIHVEKFIPGSQIIQKSQVVIHCGGSGTTYQTLLQGVPALIIPCNPDQEENAWLIEKNKLGICLSSAKLTTNQLKLAVQELLDNHDIRKNIDYFKDLLKETNAPKSAADRIGLFLKSENTEDIITV
jgi:MGT family glycosyltransferase